MPAAVNRLNIARVLTIIGFLLGLQSISYTWGHIGDAGMILTSESRLPVEHSWHHFLSDDHAGWTE